MLEHLKIENLVLIRRAEFQPCLGLNVITGETGAGKSVVMSAIRLLAGARADAQLIRDGATLAVVEGIIEWNGPPPFDFIPPFQKKARIRREISSSGKSRAFFNDCLITLTQLKTIGASLIEFADQNQARELLSSQRKLLDLWAKVDLREYRALYKQQLALQEELQRLENEKHNADLLLSHTQNQIEEIERVQWTDLQEEEALSQEHTELTSKEKTNKLLTSYLHNLQQGTAVSALLKKTASQLYQFELTSLKEAASLIENAVIEILEAERIVEAEAVHCEPDPYRLEFVESRIAEIEKIKRKYGRGHEQVHQHLQTLYEQKSSLEQLDERIEQLQNESNKLTNQLFDMASAISKKRIDAKRTLEERMKDELSSLSLAQARFLILIDKETISLDGIDSVRFFFSANPGCELSPIEQCASGGELSRIFLALKLLLAEKEHRSCLVLDEIDSNVGGVAASSLGKKLKELGKSRQLICITHFVQAAKCATNHFIIEKKVEDNETHSTISLLNHDKKEREFSRMLGEK